MVRVLVAGVTDDKIAYLETRLSMAEVVAVQASKTVAALRDAEYALLILGPKDVGMQALQILRQVRESFDADTLPIVLLLPEEAEREAALRKAVELRANQIQLPPFDAEDLAQQTAFLLHTTLPPMRTQPLDRQSGLDDWKKQQALIAPRLEILDRAAKALDAGTLSKMLARSGVFEATKLREMLVPLDQPEAVDLCSKLTTMFTYLNNAGVSSLGLVERMRTILSQSPGGSGPAAVVPAPKAPRTQRTEPYLLVVDGDEFLVASLTAEAAARGFYVSSVVDLPAAQRAIAAERPDIIVVDLVVATTWEEMTEFFRRVQVEPRVPCLVLTANSNQDARLAASRLGATVFVQKPQTPVQILKQVELTLGVARPSRTRILAVDDDEMALQAIQTIFETAGMTCATVMDPEQFWDTLEATQPDLLLLDIEMPDTNGIEMCKMVRSDPRWKSLPIIFLTMVTDPSITERVYTNGADEYASKPISADELVHRVRNRLERVRTIREAGEVDALTGVDARIRFVEHFTRLVAEGAGKRHPISIGVVNLDAFKDINASTDFDNGDAILQRLARIFEGLLPPGTLISRWTGDEFVLGFNDTSRDDATSIMSGVLDMVRQETFGTVGGHPLQVTFSAGVAEYPRDGMTLIDTYRAAAMAVAEVKRSGRNAVLSTAHFEDPSFAEIPLDVLVVHEDEALAHRVLTALSLRGFHGQWLNAGEEAQTTVRTAAASRPTLVILLHVDPPGLDGWTILRAVQREPTLQACRVIVMATSPDDDLVQEAYGLGAFVVMSTETPFPRIMHHIRQALTT